MGTRLLFEERKISEAGYVHDVVHICDYIKRHWIVNFKWKNCTLCKLHLNGTVIIIIILLKTNLSGLNHVEGQGRQLCFKGNGCKRKTGEISTFFIFFQYQSF